MKLIILSLLDKLYNNFEICIFHEFFKFHTSKVVLPISVRLWERLIKNKSFETCKVKVKIYNKGLLNSKHKSWYFLKQDVKTHALMLKNMLSSHGHVIEMSLFGKMQFYWFVFWLMSENFKKAVENRVLGYRLVFINVLFAISIHLQAFQCEKRAKSLSRCAH